MKSFILYPVCFLALTTISCSNQNSPSATSIDANSSIIGGTKAQENDQVSLSTVSILMKDNNIPFSFCTGTLISKNLVLTATHCLKNRSPKTLSVFFGTKLPKTFQGNSNIIKVKDLRVHPNYRYGKYEPDGFQTGFDDVALIVLEKEAPTSAAPVPVLNDTVLKERQKVLLAGFGLVQEVPSSIPSEVLNYTEVELAKTFGNILVTDQSHANGACSGDSGGPAYLNTDEGLIVLGVTRGPHDEAEDCRHFGEYTYASRYKTFILEKAKEMGAILPEFVDAPGGF